LSNIASGNTPLHIQLYQFIDHHIYTNTVGRPHAYLVYMVFDNRNRLVPGNSGVIQVSDPNQLRTILTNEIVVKQDGYMHTYVSNGSSNRGVSFNDFMMTAITGKTRQINHYYPYGLPIPEINEIRTDYLNKYTGKEHQTREYEERGLQAKGLEMFDFHARFWEPQLARWTSPDPAMQFSNPYLGIGNNPVMYVEPDGEFITWSINNGGFSIGVNFTPVGIPLGFGINVGTFDGFSPGIYGELGFRVGGTGLGTGATVSHGLNYNFKHKSWNTSSTFGAYASFGALYEGGNLSSNYDITNKTGSSSWGVSAGIGFGNEEGGIGFTVGYGSGGWSYGIGGY